ncbi:MAG: prolyl oligopeptidase family serine peptidase [Cyclobacteriaceae bacterium]
MKSLSFLLIFASLTLAFSPSLTLAQTVNQDSIFSTFQIEEFDFLGRRAKVVFPEKANKDRLWVWRARFWGAEPQTDLILLKKGFHLVYVDVAGLYGNSEAVGIWNRFYDYVTDTYQLNPKTVLEGFSRGGLIVYNWASPNTDKVFCIYADAPVCDFKSWPRGLYEGIGSEYNWKECLNAYSLDETSVLSYKGIPVDNCISIAKAKIPVLHVCGDADKVVPFEENTGQLAEKFRAAGGDIKLIMKKGIGHHPHSLEDPTPIVDFVLKSVL